MSETTSHTNKFGRRMYLTGNLRGATVDVESKHQEWLDGLQTILDSHEDLLAACEAALAFLGDPADVRNLYPSRLDVIATLRAAIEKAKARP